MCSLFKAKLIGYFSYWESWRKFILNLWLSSKLRNIPSNLSHEACLLLGHLCMSPLSVDIDSSDVREIFDHLHWRVFRQFFSDPQFLPYYMKVIDQSIPKISLLLWEFIDSNARSHQATARMLLKWLSAIFVGRTPDKSFERTAEILRILVAE